MLCGEYRHALDAKNRLFIPAKYREQLGESFIVIRQAWEDEQYLTVYSQSEWAEIEAKLAALPRARARDINRFWGRNGLEVSPDSQGRILLTQSFPHFRRPASRAALLMMFRDRFPHKTYASPPKSVNHFILITAFTRSVLLFTASSYPSLI